MKTDILGTGLSGLVGSRIIELLSEKYNFVDLSYDTGVDISNRDSLEVIFQKNPSNIVLHLAAKTDVDACEMDRSLGEQSDTWKINVKGTENIVTLAHKYQKKVVFISTDFVFSGKKLSYSENDIPDPINFYGLTKYRGEQIVLQDQTNLVVRITYPYRSHFLGKQDFLHKFLNRLANNQPIQAPTDLIFTPTFIDDIALALDKLIVNKCSGIYHVVGSTSLSSFSAVSQIAQIFNYSPDSIIPCKANDLYKNRASRPLNLTTNNDKIHKLGVEMHQFTQGLEIVKKQLG